MYSEQLGQAYNYGQPSGKKAPKDTSALMAAISGRMQGGAGKPFPTAVSNDLPVGPPASTNAQPQPQRSMGRPLGGGNPADPINQPYAQRGSPFGADDTGGSQPSNRSPYFTSEPTTGGSAVPRPPTSGLGASPNYSSELNKYYQDNLGRPASEADLASHQGNPNGFRGVLDAVTGSQEYADRNAALDQARSLFAPSANTAPAATAPGGLAAPGSGGRIDPGAASNQAPNPVTAAVAGNMDNFGMFAGFDADNAAGGANRDNSAKYTFFDAASATGSLPRTKEEAETWALTNIVPQLEARGYTVDWVQGDKMFVRTRENPQGEEIDFLQNAGGDDPKLAWQSNMAGQNTAGVGGAGVGATSGPTSPTLDSAATNPLQAALLGDTSKLSLAQLLQMIQDEQSRTTQQRQEAPRV